MKIFSEKNTFEKGFYTIIGVNFKEPRVKRKFLKTEKTFGLCSWFLDIFISSRHRITVEIVESCKDWRCEIRNIIL